MFQFGTAGAMRAQICWGLNGCDQNLQSAFEAWSDLEPDSYIFASRALSVADHEILLDHCVQGLAAVVFRSSALAKDSEVRDQIERRVSSIPFAETLARGAQVCGDWYPNDRRISVRAGFRLRKASNEAIDLDAIDTLDRVVFALQSGLSLRDDPLELTRLAFHAAFNPAVICPTAFSSAELLTVAAWLGLLHRGRRVMMPTFVANYWLMLLDSVHASGASIWGPDAFLLRHADQIIGLGELRDLSQNVAASEPKVIRPKARSLRAASQQSLSDCGGTALRLISH